MWLSTRNPGTKILSSIVVGLLFVCVSSTSDVTTTAAAANPDSSTHATPNTGRGPCAASVATSQLELDLYAKHPVLCEMLDRIQDDAEGVASEMTDFARSQNWLVGENLDFHRSEQESFEREHSQQQQQQDEDQLPVVFAHGMGDSCFNSGMIGIGNHASDLLKGAYVVCIPTGDTHTEDTTNGYFLSMDKSVDVFASKIATDPKLQNGFHAIGFSQGNNVIRGYIARYNTPTVHTFVSVNGVNGGEGTVPGCFPKNNDHDKLGSFCDLLLEQASRRAYTEFAQEHSFQSNYWRDPRLSEQDDYHEYSQLARWNNEGPNNNNQTLNENFAKTSKFVWVMATEDSMVWPKEGEHWGCPDNRNDKDPFVSPILPMNETEWYQKDLFGLKTAQEGGKNVFETFEGDHLHFTMEDFDRWVTTYLLSSSSSSDLQARPLVALQ
jgi:palmitoyl-protein thioesterase